jgi:hypothetical protein
MKRRARPSRRIHAVVWLLGLAILAWTGRWWPGILVLVAISILLEAAINRGTRVEIEDNQPANLEKKPETAFVPPPPAEMAPPAADRPHSEWLPLSCPKCGAPTRAGDVQWIGDTAASCPYCGSNLPLKKT